MSILSFSAKVAHVSKSKVDDYYMVGFADEKYETKHYVLLQRSILKGSNIDYMNKEYVEVDCQDNSGYDCCVSATLTPSKFVLSLDSKPDEIEQVEVDLTGVKVSKKFCEYLVEILGDKVHILEV